MVIIGDFNIDMLDQNSTQPNKLQIFMDHYFMNFSFKKSQQFMVLILIMCGQMPPFNNVCKELLKLIGLAISQFILHIDS
jgi:hypothetical protein